MGSPSGRAAPTPELIRARVHSLPRRLRRESVNGLAARWQLEIGDQSFGVSLGHRACAVVEGTQGSPDTVIATDEATWLEIDEGRITAGEAFLARRLTATGNLDLAVRLLTLFRPTGRARRTSDLDQLDVLVNGVRLSTYVLGRGRPVLLLHGLGGTKIAWTPLLAPLAARHRLIVPDLPGHGDSAKPRSGYSAAYLADAMDHLLEVMNVDRAVVVGNSMGGRVAIELALRRPDRVSALALLAPAVPGFRWRLVMGLTRVFPTEVGAIPFPLRQRWLEVAVRQLFADPRRIPPSASALAAGEFMRIYRQPAARMAFLACLRQTVTERPGPFFDSLRRIQHPALVVFGDRDGLVPPSLGARIVEHLPNARLVVLPGVGHVPQFEVPEDTMGLLDGFLETVGGRVPRP